MVSTLQEVSLEEMIREDFPKAVTLHPARNIDQDERRKIILRKQIVVLKTHK